MNIKIITIHDIENNFGSTIQACALSEFLVNNGYTNTQLIHYKPSYAYHRGKIGQILKKILFYRAYNIQKDRFANYLSEHSKLTNQYTSFEELTKLEDSDVYIVGSDQLWNEFYDAGRDESYYLGFTKSKKKMAYAASLGQLHGEETIKNLYNKTKEFSYISLREKSSVCQFNHFRNDVTHTLDPVFLLEKSSYIDEAYENKYGEYLLVYSINNDELLDYIVCEISKKLKLKIVLLGGYLQKCPRDYYLRDAGPADFLNLINNATFVVANSFHATALSIIFNKQFALTKPNNSPMRLIDMLEIAQVGNRIIEAQCELSKAFVNIDYSTTNQLISHMQKESRSFLLNSLKELGVLDE